MHNWCIDPSLFSESSATQKVMKETYETEGPTNKVV